MDFSSADVPISRETWAPQSPPPSGPRAQNNSAPPSGPSGSYSDRPAASASLPYGDEDASAQRDRPRDDRDDRGRDYRDDRDSRAPRDPYRGNDSGSSDRYQPSGAIGVVPRRPEAAPKAEPNNVLGVFGLSIRTRERDLEEEFARHGEVDKVVIVYDQRTDRSRGFGFITMKTVPDATRCVESLNGLNLHGRSIRVDYSATRKPHQPTPGQYMGEKKPIYEDRYAPRGGDFRGSRGYDDRYNDSRRSGGGDRGGRYDERDRYRDERHRREHEDPYTSRPRRDDDLDRRSPPRRSRYSASPDRRSAPRRDYDAAPPAPAATTESARY